MQVRRVQTKTVTFVLLKMFKSLLASYFLTFMRMRYTVKRTSLIWIGEALKKCGWMWLEHTFHQKMFPYLTGSSLENYFLMAKLICNFIVTAYSKRN